VTGSFYLLTFGVLLIYAVYRITTWMHGRGWIRWRMPRGTSSGLGNAMLGAQLIFQPQVREVLDVRLAEPSEAGESGDPPEPGADGWGAALAVEDRRERGRVRWFAPEKGYGQITSDEFYDVLWIREADVSEPGAGLAQLEEGRHVEYSRQVVSGPQGPRVVAMDLVFVADAEPQP
jgi:cold shock CspA family protein